MCSLFTPYQYSLFVKKTIHSLFLSKKQTKYVIFSALTSNCFPRYPKVPWKIILSRTLSCTVNNLYSFMMIVPVGWLFALANRSLPIYEVSPYLFSGVKTIVSKHWKAKLAVRRSRSMRCEMFHDGYK